jgi:hypothetical protein
LVTPLIGAYFAISPAAHVNKELGTIIWISASHLAHNAIVDYLAEVFLRVLQMFFVAFSVEASSPLVLLDIRISNC